MARDRVDIAIVALLISHLRLKFDEEYPIFALAYAYSTSCITKKARNLPG
jgi:hypothetical protein